MDKFVIEGGHRLKGDVLISGSKNASLPILAATLLTDASCTINHVPLLDDIETLLLLFRHLGVKTDRDDEHISIDASAISTVEATYDIVRKMRASVLVLGPLLARFGRARVSLPGGCAIGARPIDIHLKGLEAMGATIVLEHGYVDATAPAGGLVGAKIVLDNPSVGATENLMMAAALARGTTVIENAAREPEIVELAEALMSMGVPVQGAGHSTIVIEGSDCVGSMNHTVGPDRIETGTFIAVASATQSEITLRRVRPDQLETIVSHFIQAGCEFTSLKGSYTDARLMDLQVKGPERLKAVDIKTAPYPGFATDMQAQFSACMALAEGTSHVEETIFENRFMHVLELMRMGADITLHGHLAVVRGVSKLSAAPVMATDLRASASLVIAALAAHGCREILRIYHLDRGYCKLENKLQLLGAKVRREKA